MNNDIKILPFFLLVLPIFAEYLSSYFNSKGQLFIGLFFLDKFLIVESVSMYAKIPNKVVAYKIAFWVLFTLIIIWSTLIFLWKFWFGS
jgi:hypothetical protein